MVVKLARLTFHCRGFFSVLFSISRSDKFLTQKSATFQSVSHCVHKSQALGQHQLLYASAVMISMSMEFMNFGTSNYTTVHCVSFWSLRSMKIIWVLNFTKQKSMKFMNLVTSNYIVSVFDGDTAWKCFFFSNTRSIELMNSSQYCKNFICAILYINRRKYFSFIQSRFTLWFGTSENIINYQSDKKNVFEMQKLYFRTFSDCNHGLFHTLIIII